MRVKFFEAIECQNKPEIKWMVRLKPCRILIRHVEIKCQLDATDNLYCVSYCLLNMFQAPLCPSSGAREYYTSGCCLSYLMLGFQVVASGCNIPQTRHTTLGTTPYRQLENQSTKYDRQQPLV